MTRNQFRILVVLNQLLLFAAVVAQERFDRSFPTEPTSDPGADVSVMNPETITAVSYSYIQDWFGTAILVSGITASIGLFFGQRWGRTLFLLTCVATIFFPLDMGLYITDFWTGCFSYLATLTQGAILGLAYFSHVKRMFAKARED